MAKILLTSGFIFTMFLFSLISYSYAQNNVSSLSDQISPSTTFSFLKEIAPITEDQNSTQIFDLEGIDVDRIDNMYINDIGSNEIKKYDKNGNFITKWGSMFEEGLDVPLSHPHGNEIDDDNGNIYITDQNNKRVVKFTNNGTFITSWGSEGEDEGQFNIPWDVAVDENDEVYVPDYGNNRTQVFSTDGEVIRQFGSQGEG